MTEKINWYKEVLELEPNSKVFFPLARLLDDDGCMDEAIKVLEKGLDRHPEYLEARLFLIELLYKRGEKDNCNAQVAILRKMFTSYAGFWQAWAACLEDESDEADTASILRFLAARFLTGPLQLHEVIDRGIKSLLSERKEEPLATAQASINTDGELPAIENSETVEAHVEIIQDEPQPLVEESLSLANAEEPLAVVDENMEDSLQAQEIPAEEGIDDIREPENAALVQNKPEENIEDIPAVVDNEQSQQDEMASPAEPEVIEVDAMSEDDGLNAGTDDVAADDEQPESMEAQPELEPSQEGEVIANQGTETGIEEIQSEEIQQEETQFNAPVIMAQADEEVQELSNAQPEPVDQNALSGNVQHNEIEAPKSSRKSKHGRSRKARNQEEETVEEGYSVRTRSMAEVLAEQGDLAGALDIYKELSQRTSDAAELEDINHRISTLSARLGLNPPVAQAQEEGQGREKLIDMLEALANRVEARARN